LRLRDHLSASVHPAFQDHRDLTVLTILVILVLSAQSVGPTQSETFRTPVVDAYPSLSPDGRRLLFQSNRSGRWSLYLAKTDGEDARVLLDSGDAPVSPAWSPDGALIAYAATVAGQSEIFVMKSDGTGRRRMTFDPGYDSHPHWSRDGRLFFTSSRATPDRPSDRKIEVGEIFSMKADGSDLRQHTHCHTLCTFPSPSSDGTKIAYAR
jgi:Tol biopolymer transport system component